MPSFRASRSWLKSILLMVALCCLIAAAARPRFGVFFEEVSTRGVDLFVLLDVSRSMLAEDVAPNRLERAKRDIQDLLERLPGDRVGLIVFAGAPVVQVPLTTDHGFFRMVLEDGEDGNRVFLQHEGQEVWSKMDERLLKEMALTTKGAYIPAQTRAYDLGRIYDDHLVNLNRGEVLAEKRKRYREQFQLLGGVGLLLLLIEMVISSYPTRTGDAEGSFS